MQRPLVVTVIGGNDPSDQELAWAEEVGQHLARRGAVVVTGGRGGVMEAASKGAAEEGGLTIGILPSSDPTHANPYVSIPIATGMSYARNVIVVKSGRVVIAVGGAYGTLSEIAHALGDNIPVVGLDTWNISRNGFGNDAIIRAKTPLEAVDTAFTLANERAPKEASL